MGVDVIYYVKTKDGMPPKDPIDVPEWKDPIWKSIIRPCWKSDYKEFTFGGYGISKKENEPDPDYEIWTGDRYFRYSERYYRFWPQIRQTLEKLIKEHEAVWYSSDHCNFITHEDLVTPEFIENLESLYCKYSVGKYDE